jgi:hypothetical protein
MGCGKSRERRDDNDDGRAPSQPLRPTCGLCESPVHPDDRCDHRACGQAFHSICFESLIDAGSGNGPCPRCARPLITIAPPADRDDQMMRRGNHRQQVYTTTNPSDARISRRRHLSASGQQQSALLFRNLIAQLEAMRLVLDAQERAVSEPDPLDPALQPRPLSAAEGDDCPICQDELTTPPSESKSPLRGCVKLPCGHAFHAACADDWLQLKRECPLCRAAAHPSRLPATE